MLGSARQTRALDIDISAMESRSLGCKEQNAACRVLLAAKLNEQRKARNQQQLTGLNAQTWAEVKMRNSIIARRAKNATNGDQHYCHRAWAQLIIDNFAGGGGASEGIEQAWPCK